MQLLTTDNFDALLLDNWMPNLNGIELCRLVRSLGSEPSYFLLLGAATDDDKKGGVCCRCSGYLL